MTKSFAATPTSSVASSELTVGQFGVMAGIALLDGVGVGIIVPLLPFLVMHFSGPPVVVTQLVALYYLAGFIGSPILGALSDRIGRGRVLFVSLVGSLLSYLGILFSWSLVGVFAFRFLGGFLTGRVAVMQAAVTAGSADERHVDRISWLSAVSTIGMAGGPVVGGLVAMFVAGNIQQFHATLWFAVVLTLAAVVALACIPIRDGVAKLKPRSTAGSVRSAFGQNLRLPLALTITNSFGLGVILSVTALMVHVRFGWGVGPTGLLMGTISGAIAMTRMFLLPRLAKRLGLEWCLLLCIGVAIPCLIGMAVTHDRILFCAFIALFSCANGMGAILPTTMVSIRAEKHERGYVLGVNQGALAIAVSLSASGNGFLFDFVAPGAPHLFGALIMSIGFVMLAVALARQRYPRGEAVA